MRSSMSHGSETWPVRKENEMALYRAEMRMVRWMCGVKLKDTVSNKELRERLGIVDIMSLLQQNRLRWYGHVLRKEDNDWAKKCMAYEVVGSRPRGRPKKTWLEVVWTARLNRCHSAHPFRRVVSIHGPYRRVVFMGLYECCRGPA